MSKELSTYKKQGNTILVEEIYFIDDDCLIIKQTISDTSEFFVDRSVELDKQTCLCLLEILKGRYENES